MPHKSLLYGEDLARKTIIINEGPTDAWAIGPGAVATLGTSYSLSQVSKMVEFEKRIVCFDNEPAAQARARKLCADLSAFPGSTENCILDADDAASASRKELKLLRQTYLK
jgi:DNA primase